VSVVCRKLSCPHARGALGCDVAFTASGCIRRTFLVKTTSRSGCSQLSQASVTVLSPVRSEVAEVQRIVRSSLSPVQCQCLERKWAARKYISCHSWTHCRRLGDRLCVIFPSSPPSLPCHWASQKRYLGARGHKQGQTERRNLTKWQGSTGSSSDSRELVMLDCRFANNVQYAATTCMQQNTGFVGYVCWHSVAAVRVLHLPR
jgi:hypothetical protein